LLHSVALHKVPHQLDELHRLRIRGGRTVQLGQEHIEHAQRVLLHVERLQHVVQDAPVAGQQRQRLRQLLGQLPVASWVKKPGEIRINIKTKAAARLLFGGLWIAGWPTYRMHSACAPDSHSFPARCPF